MSPDEGLKFLALFFVFGGGFWVLGPIARALAKRIAGDGSRGADPQALDRVREELLGEMDAMRQDVAQLSERVDFTERVLAKQRDEPRVGPGIP